MKEKKIFLSSILLLMIGAVLSRWLPHPPNVTPITALALLGAAFFSKKWHSWIFPLLILAISDVFLGFHKTIPFVYGSFLLITFLGFYLRKKFHWAKLAGVSLVSSVLFFLITNFGVWLMSDMYPTTFSGLVLCYEMGLPFLRNALLGDLFYSFLLFGSVYLIKKYYLSRISQTHGS